LFSVVNILGSLHQHFVPVLMKMSNFTSLTLNFIWDTSCLI
jgi:hypothetical protein